MPTGADRTLAAPTHPDPTLAEPTEPDRTDPDPDPDPDPADFGAGVAALVRTIPAGRVMTYGGVAAALGSRASRQVGRVMAFEGGDLPWWRVVRAGGHPPVRHEARALEMYRTEGTPLVHGPSAWRVDLRRADWSPAPLAHHDPRQVPTATPDAAPAATVGARSPHQESRP